MLIDKKFRVPRIWSNGELRKFAHLFRGNVVNVSAYQDKDKEGKHYKDYFVNAESYSITNYKKEAKGFQGAKGEIFLDLEKDLPKKLINNFDVIFNHTTLEHIYEVKKAFRNICSMSKDIVILIVPFLQQMHTDYGDYWRFTPLSIKKLFEENKMQVLYSSFNENKNSSVYLFFIASKKPNKWKKIKNKFSCKCKNKPLFEIEPYAGCGSIRNKIIYYIWSKIKSMLKLFS